MLRIGGARACRGGVSGGVFFRGEKGQQFRGDGFAQDIRVLAHKAGMDPLWNAGVHDVKDGWFRGHV
ncbi:hypothetical protein CFR73_02035 [Novacetimonas maltaceti]|nr:hypothetical protein CFR73_02035 [Novacetimonas maltaceti]